MDDRWFGADYDYSEAMQEEQYAEWEREQRSQEWVDEAKKWVIKALEKWKVMYNTEIKACLGTLHLVTDQTYFHLVTQNAITQLYKENRIKRPPGRPRREKHFQRNFYYLADEDYEEIKPILRKKRLLIRKIDDQNFNNTNSRYAEDLFEQMFNDMNYIIVGRETDYFNGVRCGYASLDFIVQSRADPRRFYGVEIKNKLSYDEDTKRRAKKWNCAKHLGLVPFFVVRESPVSWIWEVIEGGGKFLLYNKYIVTPKYEKWAKQCNRLFGIRFACWKKIPQSVKDRVSLIDK